MNGLQKFDLDLVNVNSRMSEVPIPMLNNKRSHFSPMASSSPKHVDYIKSYNRSNHGVVNANAPTRQSTQLPHNPTTFF